MGNVDAGKSTLLGVLTHGGLDNGRGLARQKLFRHKHELESGRTSSVGNDILGFDCQGNVVNKPDHGNLDWTKICEQSTKVRAYFVKRVITARKRSLGQGYVFTRVCDSVHGGGAIPGQVPPWEGTPPGQVHPCQVPPPLGRYTPPGQVHPPGRYTRLAMHAGIRSTSARYASYWNESLFMMTNQKRLGCQNCGLIFMIFEVDFD